MHDRATAAARDVSRRAWQRAARHDGFTLAELLVVLAILGTVLAGLTALFTAGIKTQTDQTNRTQAQQDARLGLDKLRREIRCASSLTPTSGYPASAVTITLGSWCPTAGGASTVTWCTVPSAGGAQPYTLWRYVGTTCSGTGTKWASNLVDSASPSVPSGKIFDTSRVPAATATSTSSGGSLQSGTYTYVVTALLAGGVEVPGVSASVTVSSGLTNTVNVSWAAYTGANSYNVYGRDGGGVHLLKNTTGTSYADTGPTKLTANPLTLPSATIDVASTAGFSSGANSISFGASGVVTCTGTTSTSFTGCTGGQPGQYPQNMPVDSASSARPPRTAVSVTLPVDVTPSDTSQRFVLADSIVLRNS